MTKNEIKNENKKAKTKSEKQKSKNKVKNKKIIFPLPAEILSEFPYQYVNVWMDAFSRV